MLLDDQARVLNVNRSLAGSSFASLSATARRPLHYQLHPNCDGTCRFTQIWNKAWASLTSRDSIEWEVDDEELGRVLRFNLSRMQTPVQAAKKTMPERRERPLLVTITDITKYRREYELLVEQHQALVKMLIKQRAVLGESDLEGPDEADDTGNRLIAGYVKQYQSFGRLLILAQEKERKRIASELHDGIAQSIGVLKYNIEAEVARLARDNPELDLSVFDSIVGETKGLVDEVRRISRNLAPSMLEDFGLHVALEWLCREFMARHPKLRANWVICVDEGDLPDLIKIAIYRIVQEALSNVAKHAAATSVDLSLEMKGGGVRLMFSDNGIGFDLQQLTSDATPTTLSSLGLRSMRERVEATGGNFEIESAPGRGVVVRAEWTESELQLIG